MFGRGTQAVIINQLRSASFSRATRTMHQVMNPVTSRSNYDDSQINAYLRRQYEKGVRLQQRQLEQVNGGFEQAIKFGR